MNNTISTVVTKRFDIEQAKRVFELIDVNENTRKEYQMRIQLFLIFIQDKYLDYDTFLIFKRYLRDRNDYSASTKNKYLVTARIFLKELFKRGILSTDITVNVKSFKQSKNHKKMGITEDEMLKIVEWLSNIEHTPKHTRLKALISLKAFQGFRDIEIHRLDVKDINFANNTIFILGKGADDKELVHLHPESVKTLKEHLKINKIASGAVFTSTSNNSNRKRLSTHGIMETIKRALLSIGINKSPHGFRHFFTTTMLNAYNGNILEVQRYTRHKSIEMLVIYNDNIARQADLPKFYEAFGALNLS